MKQVIIGKLGNQPFPLKDPCVSSKHALLIIKDNRTMTLVDTNSTNGTYLYNGSDFVKLKPNTEYPVTPESFVRLGPNTQFHVRKLMPEEEKFDIKHLKYIYENYNKHKLELQANSQMVGNLRSCTILVSLIAIPGGSMLAKALMPSPSEAITWVIGAVIGVAMFLGLFSVINKLTKKNLEATNENERLFARKYVCPKCGVSHRSSIYENLLLAGECPKCHVKYYDSDTENPDSNQ